MMINLVVFELCLLSNVSFHDMGALQRGLGGPWPSQNFGWVGHNAFGPTNNWPVCLLILYCGQLILSKIGASRYQILRLKCTKFTFCWGSAPDPAGGAYSAPRPLPTSKGMEGNGRGVKKVKGKERERWRGIWPTQKFWCGAPYDFMSTTALACKPRVMSKMIR